MEAPASHFELRSYGTTFFPCACEPTVPFNNIDSTSPRLLSDTRNV